MNTPILILIVTAVLLVVFVVLYLTVISPAAQARNKLRRQARLDFQNARGTVHLKLMREAYDRHSQAHTQCQLSLDKAKRRKADVEARQGSELRKALEAHILQTRLREIAGIGETLAGQLRWHAQTHEGLDSLCAASQHVPGIGPTRQAAIDSWVTRYRMQMPALLTTEFPGKAAIVQKTTAELAEIGGGIEKLTAEEAVIAARLDRLRAEREPLERVTSATFYRAIRNPGSMPEDAERYLRGAFAEWEPVPDWFKDIVQGVAD